MSQQKKNIVKTKQNIKNGKTMRMFYHLTKIVIYNKIVMFSHNHEFPVNVYTSSRAYVLLYYRTKIAKTTCNNSLQK